MLRQNDPQAVTYSLFDDDQLLAVSAGRLLKFYEMGGLVIGDNYS